MGASASGAWSIPVHSASLHDSSSAGGPGRNWTPLQVVQREVARVDAMLHQAADDVERVMSDLVLRLDVKIFMKTFSSKRKIYKIYRLRFAARGP